MELESIKLIYYRYLKLGQTPVAMIDAYKSDIAKCSYPIVKKIWQDIVDDIEPYLVRNQNGN